MPKGRMLNKKISKDLEIAKLSCKAALLYSWCIPHLDVEGRIEASPEIIKGVVMPYRKDFTLSVIKQCIEEISQADGLIAYYGNTHKYMQFLGFNKNQTVNKDRESPSEIPAPTPEELQSKSGLSLNTSLNTSLIVNKASPALKAALNKVYKEVNIYALINKLKKQLGWPITQQFPEEVLLKVCATFDKGQVKDEWAWFSTSIKKASEEFFAEQNIKQGQEWKTQGMAQSIKDILGIK